MFIDRRHALVTKAPEGRQVTNSEIIAEEGERENEKMGSSLLPPLACGGTQGGKNFAPLRYFIKGLQFAVASAFRFPV